MHSLPTLILIGIFLYVDRVIRAEMIFDSSALTCTVFVTHILNVCRSKIAHIDEFTTSSIAAVDGSGGNLLLFSSSGRNSTSPEELLHSQEVSWWWWQQQVVLGAYCTVSVLLLLDLDISAGAMTTTATSTGASVCNSNKDAAGGGPCCCLQGSVAPSVSSSSSSHSSSKQLRISTVVLHCLFVGTLLQIPVNREEFMLSWKVLARSFTFVVLAICWTYSVGIHEMSVHVRSYPYFYNPVLQGKSVQPFTPCQLRFLVVLFLDGWFLLATAMAMVCIVTRQMSALMVQVAQAASLPSSSSSYSTIIMQQQQNPQNDDAVVVAAETAILEEVPLTLPLHAALPHSVHLQQKPQQQQVRHQPPFATASASATSFVNGGGAFSPAEDRLVQHNSMMMATSSGVEEDETLTMFKMARKAATQKLGEQI